MPESREPINEVLGMLDAFGLRRAPPPSTEVFERPDYSGAGSDAELIILWLDRYDSVQTQRAYRGDMELFRAFLAALPDRASAELPARPATLREVKVAHLTAFQRHLRDHGAVSSHARRISAVKSLLSFAHETGYLVFNVGAAVKPPRRPNQLAERILSQDEVYALIQAAAPGRDRTLLRFLYLSGARISEALALKWTEVHMEADRLRVTLHGKGGKTRHVPLPVSLIKDLELLHKTRLSSVVFESVRGRQLHQSDGWNIVCAAAEAAHLPHRPSPHWFRHAHASHALRRGAPAHLVQHTLGHASLTTTSDYVHVESNESSSMFLAA
jgi:integrase/recombinase XerD